MGSGFSIGLRCLVSLPPGPTLISTQAWQTVPWDSHSMHPWPGQDNLFLPRQPSADWEWSWRRNAPVSRQVGEHFWVTFILLLLQRSRHDQQGPQNHSLELAFPLLPGTRLQYTTCVTPSFQASRMAADLRKGRGLKNTPLGQKVNQKAQQSN